MAKKIGLAFSGGGSRAAAQLGAVKAFNESNIQIDCYSGTSAGSMVAVLAANNVDPEVVLEEIKSYSLFKLVSFSYSLSGLSSLKKVKRSLQKLLNVENLEELQKPVSVVATNLNTGKVNVFEKGPITDIVMASSSVPILFPPVKIDGSYYIDGGVLMNLPVEPLREKCDFVIGFSITPVEETRDMPYEKLVSIGMRTFELSVLANVEVSKKKCDFFLEPTDLNTIGVFSFKKMDEMFQIGYEYTRNQLSEIEKMLND